MFPSSSDTPAAVTRILNMRLSVARNAYTSGAITGEHKGKQYRKRIYLMPDTETAEKYLKKQRSSNRPILCVCLMRNSDKVTLLMNKMEGRNNQQTIGVNSTEITASTFPILRYFVAFAYRSTFSNTYNNVRRGYERLEACVDAATQEGSLLIRGLQDEDIACTYLQAADPSKAVESAFAGVIGRFDGLTVPREITLACDIAFSARGQTYKVRSYCGYGCIPCGRLLAEGKVEYGFALLPPVYKCVLNTIPDDGTILNNVW